MSAMAISEPYQQGNQACFQANMIMPCSIGPNEGAGWCRGTKLAALLLQFAEGAEERPSFFCSLPKRVGIYATPWANGDTHRILGVPSATK